MKIKFVYLIFPVFIFYRNSFLKNTDAGKCIWFFIFIRPEYRDDKGLLWHEITHAKQFYRTFGIHAVLAMISSSHRLKCESEAYAVQLSYYYDDLTALELKMRALLFAECIATYYNIDISKEDAYKRILEYTKRTVREKIESA